MKKQILASSLILLISLFPIKISAESIEDLESQIQELEKAIKENESRRKEKESQARSLERDVSVLTSEINETNLKIKQTELAIKKISRNISQKEKEIDLLTNKIGKAREVIAEYIRSVNYYDDQSLLEVLLKEEKLSGMIDEIARLEAMQDKLQESLEQFRVNQELAAKQKIELEENYEDQDGLKKLQYDQRKTVQSKKNQVNSLLSKTKLEEKTYNQEIQKGKNEIANIRARIVLLQSGGRELSFEEALRLAQYAAGLTRVRAALILSVLWQESSFGRNLGECNYQIALRNRSETWINNQTRAFLQITSELNQDPGQTVVSCPIKDANGNYIGSGGAMGPAQFMPSTWLAYRNDVKGLVGHLPDPWKIEDAIVAMAYYLKLNGGLSDERRAAGAYFGKCSFGWVDYCDSVLARAEAYQKEIDKI